MTIPLSPDEIGRRSRALNLRTSDLARLANVSIQTATRMLSGELVSRPSQTKVSEALIAHELAQRDRLMALHGATPSN